MSDLKISESRNTRSQLYWNTLVRLPAQVINFAISLLVARILMPRDFGIMGIAMMLIGYTNLFTNFGFAEAIIQKNIHDRKILNSIFTFNLFVSSLLAGGFFLAAGMIADFFHTPECKMVIRVLSIVFIITSLSIVPGAVLRRDMDFKAVAIFDLIQAVLMSVATLLLAYKSFGYWALVYGQLVPLAVVSVLLCVKVRYFPFINYNHSLMKDIYNFGGWNFFRVQLLFLTQHVDRFIVGKWLGTVQLGFYDKAITLATTPYNSLTMNINAVMFSSFSRDKDNVAILRESFKKSIALLSLINLPIYIGLIVIAPHFVNTLLGDKWQPMIIPFQIILIGFIFRSFMGIVTSLNIGVGKYRNNAIRSFVAFLLFATLCTLFRNQNIIAISMCFMAYCIFDVVLLTELSCQATGLRFSDVLKAVLPGLISSFIMYFITITAAHFLFEDYTIINMFLLVLIGGATYTLAVALNRSNHAIDIKLSLMRDSIKIFLRG